jgi:glycosyltransferase involved in cell wall biosynthesis
MAGVLFAHSNFPGQFAPLAEELVRRRAPVAAVTNTVGRPVPGVLLAQWSQARQSTPEIHPLALRAERDFLGAEGAFIAACRLKESGFDPDYVVAHPRFGSPLFLREVYPRARHIVHAEFYYHSKGGDGDFDPEFFKPGPESHLKTRALNAPLALAYAEADILVTPTQYQKSLLPTAFRDRAIVIHEGVDAGLAKPDPEARLRLASGLVLDRTRPVVTYVTRRFEPLRGAHIFLRALPRLFEAVPDVQVVAIGSDDPNVYGLRMDAGRTWRGFFLDQLAGQLDLGRLHFTGVLPYNQMLSAMAISTAHVYYTYPFVLSWSVLEAMACECLVIGSNTPPVAEAITSGKNGILLDFFDVEALSDQLIAACRNPDGYGELRREARRTVLERFDREQCLAAWLGLVGQNS